MGHLYRALNFISYLNTQNQDYIIFINDDPTALSILDDHRVNFITVDLTDISTNWESKLICDFDLTVWLNDRLNTELKHAQNVKTNNVLLVTFDDFGSGAAASDLNFGGLIFEKKGVLQGLQTFSGIDYLILSKEIDQYKRLRSTKHKIIVTMGGSDTFGATLKVVGILKANDMPATIITGPSFAHIKQLSDMIDARFVVKQTVPSLVKEFSQYDLAITGGGITPFEANASGLPCIIIANELHEIPNALYLQNVGASLYAGHHTEIKPKSITKKLDISSMSKVGLNSIHTRGAANIYQTIKNVKKNLCKKPQ